MLTKPNGTHFNCTCGTCVAVGSGVVGGGFIAWWMYADDERRAAEAPSKSMFDRGTCDTCGYTVKEAIDGFWFEAA
jgi:hypothetical protein